VAASNDRIVVVWVEPVSPVRGRLAWSVYDAASGQELDHRLSPAPVDARSGPAIAFNGGRFVAAWGGDDSDPQIRMATLFPARGPIRVHTVPLGVDGPLDLAATPSGFGLVAQSQGGIRWALVDRRGRIGVGPFIVSIASAAPARAPTIAWNGQVFAVAWQTRISGGQVVAVDRGGLVSSALDIVPGITSRIADLAGTDRGFLASSLADSRVSDPLVAIALECVPTAHVSRRAPDRIEAYARPRRNASTTP
jgi:hypothetical protein